MPLQNFVDFELPVITAAWLNAVDAATLNMTNPSSNGVVLTTDSADCKFIISRTTTSAVTGEVNAEASLFAIGTSTDSDVVLRRNSVEYVRLDSTVCVFNDTGVDYDLRVEGATEANLLFIDASTDRIGVGTATPTTTLQVVGTLTTDLLSVQGTAAGVCVFNETGVDCDLRAEGDTDVNLLFLDASTDRIGVGTATPATKLDVVGTLSADGLALDKTVTAGATTGAQTINKPMGSVNFAAAASTLVVTNSLVTTSSIILATVATADATMLSVQVVAASGSFTIHANAAATAETRVNWLVVN